MSERNGLVFKVVTLITLMLVGLLTAWTDWKTSKKLDTIHIEVNSNMKEQVRETKELRENLEELKREFRDQTGHEFKGSALHKFLSMFETKTGHVSE